MGMWEKIKRFFANPIVQFIGPGGIIGMITWIWTNAAQLPIWGIWLAVLFSIGCSFWLVNQINIWSERHKKKLSQYSIKELNHVIREWLSWPTFSLTPVPASDCHFKYQLADPVGKLVYIENQISNPSLMLIGTRISLGDISNIPDNLHALLAIDLARHGVMFSFEQKGQNDIIEIHHIVPISDDLNIYQFRREVMFVLRALVMIGVLKDYIPKKKIDNSNK